MMDIVVYSQLFVPFQPQYPYKKSDVYESARDHSQIISIIQVVGLLSNSKYINKRYFLEKETFSIVFLQVKNILMYVYIYSKVTQYHTSI